VTQDFGPIRERSPGVEPVIEAETGQGGEAVESEPVPAVDSAPAASAPPPAAEHAEAEAQAARDEEAAPAAAEVPASPEPEVAAARPAPAPKPKPARTGPPRKGWWQHRTG
jgi:ribonuclease E